MSENEVYEGDTAAHVREPYHKDGLMGVAVRKKAQEEPAHDRRDGRVDPCIGTQRKTIDGDGGHQGVEVLARRRPRGGRCVDGEHESVEHSQRIDGHQRKQVPDLHQRQRRGLCGLQSQTIQHFDRRHRQPLVVVDLWTMVDETNNRATHVRAGGGVPVERAGWVGTIGKGDGWS